MSFAPMVSLPAHPLNFPVQSNAPLIQAPQVYDTQKIVDHGWAQINKIIDDYSPLNITERKAKLAHAVYMQKAYQDANRGDFTMLRLMHDFNDANTQLAARDAHESHVRSMELSDPKNPANSPPTRGQQLRSRVPGWGTTVPPSGQEMELQDGDKAPLPQPEITAGDGMVN